MTMKDITKRNVDVEHHGDISTTVNILIWFFLLIEQLLYKIKCETNHSDMNN